MGLLNIFKRKPELSIHDEFHKYTDDITKLSKQRDGLLQKIYLHPSDTDIGAQFRNELIRANKMIEGAQRAILQLKEREEIIRARGK